MEAKPQNPSQEPALDCAKLPKLEAEDALATESNVPVQASVALLPQLPALRSSNAWMQGSTDTGSQQAWTHAAALQSDWSHLKAQAFKVGLWN